MKIFNILIFLGLVNFGLKAQQTQRNFDFEFEGVTINGVLNLPEHSFPKGLVLIVHGSGQTNAVEQEWYKDVRMTFIEAGYSTYMWDKQGCGKSGGTFDYNQSVQNSAEEVIAAIETLKDEKIAGSSEIALWGISRAGWINPIVINKYKNIKFWISVSGVDDKENFNYLLEENLRIDGFSEDSIRILVQELKEGVRLTYEGESYETYMAATENLRKNAFWRRFSNGNKITRDGYYTYQSTFVKQEFDIVSGLIVYVPDFAKTLSNVKCPVLALFGEQDKNVDWEKTKSLYERTMGESSKLSIESFEDCNHNLFQCETGGFYEFQDNNLPWNRCEGFLDAMKNWLKELE